MLDMPYFMENEKWFYFDGKKRKFVLTKDAPSEAKRSYQEYYDELEKEEKNGSRKNKNGKQQRRDSGGSGRGTL